MRNPKISVVVPVYNVEAYVAQCMDSVLTQDFGDFEVVVVNDGSTDSSREVLARYAADPRVRVVDQPNMGLSGARNTGLSHARGEWVAFIDSDDYVGTGYLSWLFGKAVANGADLVACGRAVDSGGIVTHPGRPGFAGRPLGPSEAFRALNSYTSFDMSMCAKLIKADLFDGLEFPVGKNSEDQFVCYRLLLRARAVYYADEPIYFYRHRKGSISRGSRVNVFPLEASAEQLTYARENCPELAFAAEASRFFSSVAVFNAFAARGLDLPAALAPAVLSEPRGLLPGVLKNPDIPGRKKLQALLYCLARPAYKRIYLMRRG